MIGLLGRKIGMTRIFTPDGAAIPVSLVEVLPNRVSQKKTVESDGYDAVQLTGGTKKASHVKKPMAGHFAKSAAYKAACDLVFKGKAQPSGYTEPLLHAWRLKVKAAA